MSSCSAAVAAALNTYVQKQNDANSLWDKAMETTGVAHDALNGTSAGISGVTTHIPHEGPTLMDMLSRLGS